jgi:hypothetical protein
MAVRIPAPWAVTGHGVPNMCVAHGQPTADRIVVRIYSRPPFWLYLLVPLGGVILAVIVWYAIRRTMVAVWPYCPSCRVLRIRNVVLAVMLGVAGGLGVPFAVTAYDGSGLVVFLLAASALCLLVGLGYAGRSSTTAIAGAELSRDGQWVLVRRPPPAFAATVAQWTAAPAAAAPPAAGPPAAGPPTAPARTATPAL